MVASGKKKAVKPTRSNNEIRTIIATQYFYDRNRVSTSAWKKKASR